MKYLMALYCRERAKCSCRDSFLCYDEETREIVENFEEKYGRKMPCGLAVTTSPTFDSAVAKWKESGGNSQDFALVLTIDKAVDKFN